VRKRCASAEYVVVVEMNMGQILGEVKKVVHKPESVFLANRVDGGFITPPDVLNVIRIIQGKGV